MSGWRKWLRRAGWTAFGLILCFVTLCELRNPVEEVVVVSEDTEKILRQVPEVEITEADRELLEDLLRCPGVKALLEKDEISDLRSEEDPELAATAEAYLGSEISGSASVSVLPAREDGSQPLIFTWRNSESEISIVERTERDGDVEYYKCYGRDEWNGRRGVYENFDNERAQKSTGRRRWFAYFRDRMWEDS